MCMLIFESTKTIHYENYTKTQLSIIIVNRSCG